MHWVAVFAVLLAFGGAPVRADSEPLSAGEARAIAKEAYVFGYPLVESYRIQHSYFVQRGGPAYKGAWNELHSVARVPAPGDAERAPDLDVQLSYLGADLRAEPLVLSVPEIESSRYYSLQFVDMYTFDFAYAGSRTTGNGAGRFLLVGPHWKGEKPPGVKDVIRSETDFAFVIYRTRLFDAADLANVRKIQAGYTVQPLSRFLGKAPPAAPPAIAFVKPLGAEEQRSSAAFFEILDFALRFCPTHPTEQDLRARFARLGIGGGSKRFEAHKLSPAMRKAVEDGIADAWQANEALRREIGTGAARAADMTGTRDFLKNNYAYRMQAAVAGIYTNSTQELATPLYVVDPGGGRLDGEKHTYALRLSKDKLPPVNGFWSLTLYDAASSGLYANPQQRYRINSSMLQDLKVSDDGGISIWVQREAPGRGRDANWLPTPAGPFWLALRLYWPTPEAVSGGWNAPDLLRTDFGKP